MFSALRFPTEEISRAGRIMAKAARFREERTGKHSNYLGGETSVDGVPPFQRQHGGMIGASTGSYVYPRICGSFFLSFFFFRPPFPLFPSLFLPSLPRLPIHSGGSAVSQRSLSSILDSSPFSRQVHVAGLHATMESFPFYLVVFRIFLGVTSPIPYIVTRLFSNIIIIYLTIRIYNRKHGFVFLNQFSFTYIYIYMYKVSSRENHFLAKSSSLPSRGRVSFRKRSRRNLDSSKIR